MHLSRRQAVDLVSFTETSAATFRCIIRYRPPNPIASARGSRPAAPASPGESFNLLVVRAHF